MVRQPPGHRVRRWRGGDLAAGPRRSTTGATGAAQPTGASPLARQATGELARQQAPRAQHLGGSIDSWRRLPRTCLRRSSAADSDVEPDFDFELKMDDGHHVFDGMLARGETAAQRGRRGSMPRIRYSGDVGSTRPLGCDTPGKRWPMQVHQSSKVCCSSSGLKLISHQIS